MSKKNEIKERKKAAFNVDACHVFLYGNGTGEESGALVQLSQDDSSDIRNTTSTAGRISFFERHFGTAFTAMLNTIYFSEKGDKEKSEFLKEICSRETNKRGTASFLDTVCMSFLDNRPGFTLDELIQINMRILESQGSPNIDDRFDNFIATIIKKESALQGSKKERKFDSVNFTLQYLKEMSSRNRLSENLPESRARVLALLLLSALLRERFPTSLLVADKQKLSDRQLYAARNIFCAVQINISALLSLISSQEQLLTDIRTTYFACNDLDSNKKYNEKILSELSGSHLLQLGDIEMALLMLDYTDINAIVNECMIAIDRPALSFLHDAVFFMKGFAKQGMHQIMDYIAKGIHHQVLSFTGAGQLADAYLSCLAQYRRLIYWNIVLVCRRMPYEIVKDMEIIASYIAPGEQEAFAVRTGLATAEIRSRCISMEKNFRDAMGNVADHNITLLFPDYFYRVGFSREISDGHWCEEKQFRRVTYEDGESAEIMIIEAFFNEYKNMDTISHLQDGMLNMLELICDAPPEHIDYLAVKLDPTISKYAETLERHTQRPLAIVTAPLSEAMENIGIMTAEFQAMTNQTYALASDCLRYIRLIQMVCAAGLSKPENKETFQAHISNARESLNETIAYLKTMPGYIFAGWAPEWKKIIYDKSLSLRILQIKQGAIPNIRFDAESAAMGVLDEIENRVMGLSRKVAKDKWELAEMKIEFEQQLAALSKAK